MCSRVCMCLSVCISLNVRVCVKINVVVVFLGEGGVLCVWFFFLETQFIINWYG